jgi:hypothetical protein
MEFISTGGIGKGVTTERYRTTRELSEINSYRILVGGILSTDFNVIRKEFKKEYGSVLAASFEKNSTNSKSPCLDSALTGSFAWYISIHFL